MPVNTTAIETSVTNRAQSDRNTRLRKTYEFVVQNWATGTKEIADALYEGDAAKARRDLQSLQEKDLVTPYDVNDEAQGSLRSGEFKSFTWQSFFDVENGDTLEDAMASFDVHFPTTTNAQEGDTMTDATVTEPAADTPTTETPKPKATTKPKTGAKAKAAAAKPKAAAKPAAEKSAAEKKVPLTLSQRRRLLELAKGSITPKTTLSAKPLDYFVKNGLATKSAKGAYKVTPAGKKRADDVNPKYAKATKAA